MRPTVLLFPLALMMGTVMANAVTNVYNPGDETLEMGNGTPFETPKQTAPTKSTTEMARYCGTGTKFDKDSSKCVPSRKKAVYKGGLGQMVCTANYVPPPGFPATCPDGLCGEGTHCVYDPRQCHYTPRCTGTSTAGKPYQQGKSPFTSIL
ncbi:MAG: hypothetical protein DHS80DRAFT_28713 [Piptocephalis tieghemiana]|nr:MAG: hypothetical protein DHS80DRAFT_28713 [Piptocephalis tieghemiana]